MRLRMSECNTSFKSRQLQKLRMRIICRVGAHSIHVCLGHNHHTRTEARVPFSIYLLWESFHANLIHLLHLVNHYCIKQFIKIFFVSNNFSTTAADYKF